MPSPIGHALGGMAVGWLIDPTSRGDGRAARVRLVAFGAAGAAADLDLLVGAHRGPSHALCAALVVGLGAWAYGAALRRGDAAHVRRLAVAVGLAYASHTLLDWLGRDTSPPLGIMALWPFDRGYYESRLHLFSPISRRYWLPEFWIGNFGALARELVILLPVGALVALLRRRPPAGA
ncbi:MAG: metal-dependent hydrolase [Acidobacteriota bacterium]